MIGHRSGYGPVPRHCRTPRTGSAPINGRKIYVGVRVSSVACLLWLSSVGGTGAIADDFEDAPAGPFERMQTDLGVWQVIDSTDADRALIESEHASWGRHCLQITGKHLGQDPREGMTTVELKLAHRPDADSELSFVAERWTSKPPFSFRIDALNDSDWTEIYNGDSLIEVGRSFRSKIKISLGESPPMRLRFRINSPPATGVLIDHVRIAAPKPQVVVGVESPAVTLPALIGKPLAPLAKLRIETNGTLQPVSIRTIAMELDATTDLNDLASVELVFGGEANALTDGKRVDVTPQLRPGRREFTVTCPESWGPLVEGGNHVWVACSLSKHADISHRVGARFSSITFSDGRVIPLEGARNAQRMGISLRDGGADGVHTYRIPGLATTNAGTLIAVYDIRYRGGGDLPGDIDVGMSRSTDGGRTWEPMRVIMDMGDDPAWRYDGIGDPAVLVDRNTGTIWVAGLWSHGNRGWWGTGPGLSPEETGQLVLVRSDDDGRTWSAPINITDQVKRPEWCLLFQGPGMGITMRDGTLVFAAQYQDSVSNKRLPRSTIIYSRDHGIHWSIGTGAFDDTTEAQVVESEPGVLMLNCRYNRAGVRVVMTTRDMGQTWQRHPTSERSLIEPGACMASLIDASGVRNRSSDWLLFSNPNHPSVRSHITVRASPDRGLTWPAEHQILLDEGRGAGYSCLTMIDEHTVGILYEGSQAHLTFQRIPLSEWVDHQ
ncbi:sialidase family protein [Neorhodopirellula pilleata]|uniref:exo-alpha-sialidase n=1 Tax=Neorhodopirellula pilleata TaxID=2714738 RepID=A0A5C6AUZ7_9BACT|nr:sialidase family protein [Neorhodopirellula pilleata]TWU03261.1 Sialidase precursor [Neorhodopirellula pilleata]